MIPGLMMPPGLIGAGGGAPPITLRSSKVESTNSASYTLPSDIEAGDIIVIAVRGNSSAHPPTPSGYTSLGSSGGDYGDGEGEGTRIAFKVATSGDAGATITKHFQWHQHVVLVFAATASGGSAGTPQLSNVTNSAPANITIPSPTAPAISIGTYAGSSGTFDAASKTASPNWDGFVDWGIQNGSPRRRIGYKMFDDSASAITMSQGDGGSANHMIGNRINISR